MRFEERNGAVRFRVRVQPRASRNAVGPELDGHLRVALTAPPAEGAANSALRALMAKTLGVSKTSIDIVTGEKSREKTLAVSGLSAQEVRTRLDGVA